MERVDRYIDLVYKNVKGNEEEINIIKQEMKNHLLQSINELQAEGKSEEASIDIAISRFGEVNQIKKELAEVYSVQKKFSRNILIIALVILFMGVVSLISKISIHQYTKHAQLKLLDDVTATINQNDGISEQKVNRLFEDSRKSFKYDNKNLKYIAIFQYPKDYKERLDTSQLKNAKYIYPNIEKLNDNLVTTGYIANTYSEKECLSTNNRWYLSIGYISPDSQYSINDMLKFFIIGCFVAYWVLFGVWATIKAYHIEGYNLRWFALFFLFNIFAYILFRLKNINKVNELKSL